MILKPDLDRFPALFFTPGYRYDQRIVKLMRVGAQDFSMKGIPVFPRRVRRPIRPLPVGRLLVLLGEREIGFNPNVACDAAARALPGALIEKVPRVGHLMTLEAVDAVNDRLLRFLSGPLHPSPAP
jgi:pimeloyl-ACP methyl ester carboxylesterase